MSYKRVLLKVSGEALAQEQGFGISVRMIQYLTEEVKKCLEIPDLELAIVIGGGNIHRGLQGALEGVERTTSDYMGMLATMMNALALQSSFEVHHIESRILSGLKMEAVAEPYIWKKAVHYLEKKNVVIFAAGTGNPYFTTDTAAALRANEIKADVILKATKVDGIYSEDPQKNPQAQLYKKLTYKEVLEKNLKIMDATAFTLCQEEHIPIIVYNLFKRDYLKRIILGETLGSLIESGEKK